MSRAVGMIGGRRPATMAALLRRRNFALLWSGGLISLAGDWLLYVGFPLFVYQQTGSTLATGTMLMAGTLPRILLGSVAGVFVDRWDRKRTMIGANLLLALGLLPLLLVHSRGGLPIVYVVAFVESALGQFVGPAAGALLPRVVGEDQLAPANALGTLSNNLARLGGPALGGVVFTLLGLAGAALLDAASFLIAGALVALVSIDGAPAHPLIDRSGGAGHNPWVAVWSEWVEGLRIVARERPVFVLFAFIAITGIGEGVIDTLFVPFATRVLGGSAATYSALLSTQAVGGLLGSLLLGRVGSRVAPLRLLGVCGVAFGLIDLAMFTYPLFVRGVAPTFALIALVGVPAAGMGVAYSTVLQSAGGDAHRGRLFGVFGATTALAGLLGMALAGALGDRLGIVPVLSIQGAGYALAGALVLAVLRGRVPAATRTAQTGRVRGAHDG